MFNKSYWVDFVKIHADGHTTVRIQYTTEQTGTPANSTVTGVTAGGGSFVSATAVPASDTAHFKVVDLEFTTTPTIDAAYTKNETYFEH